MAVRECLAAEVALAATKVAMAMAVTLAVTAARQAVTGEPGH